MCLTSLAYSDIGISYPAWYRRGLCKGVKTLSERLDWVKKKKDKTSNKNKKKKKKLK